MKRFSLVIFAIYVLSIGCTTPNMVIMSHHNPEYSFSKKKRIILALPKNPTEFERNLIPPLRSALRQNGFRVVDSIVDADRILSFRFIPEMHTTNRAYLSSSRPLQGKGVVSNVIETFDTLSYIAIDVRDIAAIKSGKDGLVWESNIATEPEFFVRYPDQIFSMILKQYGKAVVRKLRFKPSKTD